MDTAGSGSTLDQASSGSSYSSAVSSDASTGTSTGTGNKGGTNDTNGHHGNAKSEIDGSSLTTATNTSDKPPAKLPWAAGFTVLTNSIRLDSDDLVETAEEREVSRCSCQQKSPKDPTCYNGKCFNFACMTECVKCFSTCQNKRIQQCKTWPVEVKEAPNKGHGIFTPLDVPAGTYLFEYIGEIISLNELERRRVTNLRDEHMYVMEIKRNSYLDSTRMGNISRFINHSCDPNCTAEVWNVRGRYRVGIFTTKAVPAGGELTFDYQWEPLANRPLTKCYCGSDKCRGTIEIASNLPTSSTSKGAIIYNSYYAAVKKGQWRSSRDALMEANAAASAIDNNSSSNTSSTSTNSDTSTSSSSRTDKQMSSDAMDIEDATSTNIGTTHNNSATSTTSTTTTTTTTTTSTSTPSSSTTTAANTLAKAAAATNPEWLINKRVKIWWEGNQAYFEGDVTAYNENTCKHTICYCIDGSIEAELLWVKPEYVGGGDNLASIISSSSPSTSTSTSVTAPMQLNVNPWMWLDETREDRKIQRRERSSGFVPVIDTSAMDIDSSSTSGGSSTTGESTSISTSTSAAVPYVPVHPSMYKRKATFDFSILAAAYLYHSLIGRVNKANLSMKSDLLPYLSAVDGDIYGKVRDTIISSENVKNGRNLTRYLEPLLECLRSLYKDTNIWVLDTYMPIFDTTSNTTSNSTNSSASTVIDSGSALIALVESGLYRSGTRYEYSNSTGTSTRGDGKWMTKTYQLHVLGLEEIVSQVESLVVAANKAFAAASLQWRIARCRELVPLQSIHIRNDWRVLFTAIAGSSTSNILQSSGIITAASASSNKDGGELVQVVDCSSINKTSLNTTSYGVDAATFYDALLLDCSNALCTDAFYSNWMANNAPYCTKLFGPRGLLLLKDSANIHTLFYTGCCSDGVYIKFISTMRAVCKRLHYSTAITLRAVFTLLRALRVYNEAYVSMNASAIIGACIVIASKSLNLFRPKSLLKIALSIHCEQFNREEKHELMRYCGLDGISGISQELITPSAGSVCSLHIHKIVVEERKLVLKFGFDIVGIDCLSLCQAASPINETTCTTSGDSTSTSKSTFNSSSGVVPYETQLAVLSGAVSVSKLQSTSTSTSTSTYTGTTTTTTSASTSTNTGTTDSLLEAFLLFLLTNCCVPSFTGDINTLRSYSSSTSTISSTSSSTSTSNGTIDVDSVGCSLRLDSLSTEHWTLGAALVMHALWNTSSSTSSSNASASRTSGVSSSSSSSGSDDLYSKPFRDFPLRHHRYEALVDDDLVLVVSKLVLGASSTSANTSANTSTSTIAALLHAVNTVCAVLLSLSKYIQHPNITASTTTSSSTSSSDVSFVYVVGTSSLTTPHMNWITDAERIAEIPNLIANIMSELDVKSTNNSSNTSANADSTTSAIARCPHILAPIYTSSSSATASSTNSTSTSSTSTITSAKVVPRAENKAVMLGNNANTSSAINSASTSTSTSSKYRDEGAVLYNDEVYWLSNREVNQHNTSDDNSASASASSTANSTRSEATINRFKLVAECNSKQSLELNHNSLNFVTNNTYSIDGADIIKGVGKVQRNYLNYVAVSESSLLAINALHAFDTKIVNINVNESTAMDSTSNSITATSTSTSTSINDSISAPIPPELISNPKLRLASVRKWSSSSIDSIEKKRMESQTWLSGYYSTSIPTSAISELVLFERLLGMWTSTSSSSASSYTSTSASTSCPYVIAPAAVGNFISPPIDTSNEPARHSSSSSSTSSSAKPLSSTSTSTPSRNTAEALSPSRKRMLETPEAHATPAVDFMTPISLNVATTDSTEAGTAATTISDTISSLQSVAESASAEGSAKKRRRQFAFPTSTAAPETTPESSSNSNSTTVMDTSITASSAIVNSSNSSSITSLVSNASNVNASTAPLISASPVSNLMSGSFGTSTSTYSINSSSTDTKLNEGFNYSIKFGLFGRDSDSTLTTDTATPNTTTTTTSSASVQKSVKTELYLLFPPVYMQLSECVSIIKCNGVAVTAPGFVALLMHDVFTAVDYCTSTCGVVFRYLCIDHFVISATGRVVLYDLSGACSLESVSAHINSMASKKGSTNTSSSTSSTTSASSSNATRPAGSSSGTSTSATSSTSSKIVISKKPSYVLSFTLPSNMLYCTAPEVLLGAPASVASSVWCAAFVCMQIVLGSPLFRTSGPSNQIVTETLVNTHFQSLFRCLGTPKAVGFNQFDAMPLGPCIKPTVTAPNNTGTECRFRLAKHLVEIAPKGLLAAFASPTVYTDYTSTSKSISTSTSSTTASTTSVSDNKGPLRDEWRGVGHLAVLVHCLHLAPQMRPPSTHTPLQLSTLFNTPVDISYKSSSSSTSADLPTKVVANSIYVADRVSMFKQLIISA